MSLRFHHVVSDMDPGNEDFMTKGVGGKMWVQIKSFVLPIQISF